MGRKHYSVDEVSRSLSQVKGCVITHEFPITRQVKDVIPPDEEKIKKEYEKFIKTNSDKAAVAVLVVGLDDAHKELFTKFQNENPTLFQGKQVTRDIVVQPPYTVNISKAHDLGNGSWGKIDFLTRHMGYHIMK